MRRLLGLLLGVSLLQLGAASRPGGLADVTAVRVWEHSGYTRIVVEVSRASRYETHLLEDPPRLYLDIEEVWIEEPHRKPQTLADPGPVREVRGGQNTLRRARVVVELDWAGRTHRTFSLRKPFRIVTDVYHEPPARPLPRRPSARSFDTRPVHRVVIDAGHGGKDPGAQARSGLREKDVVLRVARELRDQLKKEGLDVRMTRDGDRYLSLEERTGIANSLEADLFVSIHANASRKRSSHGVETYLLDTRYDKQTARVAARENGTTVADLDDLHKILASLRLGYNERFAARLAFQLHRSLVGELRRNYRGTQDLGVKRGPFMVLFAARMPAVLVEIGFLSNASEAKRLRSKAFTKATARGIASGILAYRNEHARRLLAER